MLTTPKIKFQTRFMVCPNGWIDSGLFYLWFYELFLKNIPTRPVLLLDGHSTHYTPREAQKEGVCVLPNTTHAAQPLDVSFFGPLKKYWSSVCHSYVSENRGRVVTKYTFSGLFRQAWYKTISPGLIVAGFRKVGVCPFNRTAIQAVSLDECRAGGDPTQDINDYQNENTDVQTANNANEDQTGENLDLSHPFTKLEEELFQLRYENGYNFFIDPNYVSWLQLHHPESLPEHLSSSWNMTIWIWAPIHRIWVWIALSVQTDTGKCTCMYVCMCMYSYINFSMRLLALYSTVHVEYMYSYMYYPIPVVKPAVQNTYKRRSRKCIQWHIPVHAIFAVFYLFFLPVLSRTSFTSRTPNKDQRQSNSSTFSSFIPITRRHS